MTQREVAEMIKIRGRGVALLLLCMAVAGCGGPDVTEEVVGTADAGPPKEKTMDRPDDSAAPAPVSATMEFSVTRVFDAPVELVWRAWTEPEHIMRWWGPMGFTSPMAKMDVRVGGVSLVCMRAPKEFGGQDMYNTWTYSKVEPMRRLEFVGRFADKDGNPLDPGAMGLPPGIPAETPQVVTLALVGEGRTEMTITEYGYSSEQAVALSRMGLEQCLDKMAASFGGP